MKEILEKLVVLTKFAGVTLTPFAFVASIFWGGDRVFEGFAQRHGLLVSYSGLNDPAHLRHWGLDLLVGPLDDIVASPIFFGLFVVAFVVLASALVCHVMAQKPVEERHTAYDRRHPLLSALFLLLLTTLLLLPHDARLFFLALLLFCLFTVSHLYVGAKGLKRGGLGDRMVYVASIGLLFLVMLFLPTIYGRAYFSPTVWSSDVREGVIWLAEDKESVHVEFSTPGSKVIVLGELFARRDDGLRSLTLIQQEAREYDPLGTEPIPFDELLAMEVNVRPPEGEELVPPPASPTEDLASWDASFEQAVKELTAAETSHGYPTR